MALSTLTVNQIYQQWLLVIIHEKENLVLEDGLKSGDSLRLFVLVVLLETDECALLVGINILRLNDFHLEFTGLAQLRCLLLLARSGELPLDLLEGAIEVKDGLLEFHLSDE
jgi:hypothetical protein